VATAEQERNKALVANLAGNTSEGGRRVQGVLIEDLKIGTGKVCKIGDRIKMHYIGKLKTNGKVFDSSVNKPFVFRLGRGEVIGGWEIGCQGMAIGGKRRLTIPPEKAYGRAGAPPTIPGNATLVFEVSLVDIA
jgi:FK506-binding nuclear protein